jgi:hypothetical protein
MPAVLLEAGSIVNRNEEIELEKPERRGLITDSAAKAVESYPLASVGTLVLGLRCGWCSGSAPMPKLVGLFALPPARRTVSAMGT